ncbi:hypothetical protein U9M48_026963, partial [Paspalum notatum var. saurae]
MLQMDLWDKQLKIKWNLIVVYGPAHEEGKKEFLAELSSFCSNFHELREIHMCGGNFTWTNNQNPQTRVKLDRVSMNKSWENFIPG